MIRRLGLLACVAGCLLSACGTSSADNPAASRSVRAAIATTDRQGTAHIVSLEQVKGATGTAGTTTISLVGDVRFVGPEANYTTAVSSPGHQAVPVRSVVIGSDLYLDGGGATEPQWQHVRLRTDFAVFGFVTTKQLLAISSSAIEVGRTTLAGRSVTEFTVHDPGGPISVNSTGLKVTMDPFDLHLWVDVGGRMVQLAADQTAVRGSPRYVATSSTTVKLSDFGLPVTVMAPSPVASGAPSGSVSPN